MLQVEQVVLCFTILIQYASVGLAMLRLRRKTPSLSEDEGVTILKPVSGLENNLELTLGSSFHVKYPHYELLFCAATPDDPAIPIVKGLMEAFPGVDARLLVGDRRISDNPKLNNLAKGWEASSYEMIVVSDSNVEIPADYLQRLLECRTEQTAFVCSPPVAVEAHGLAAQVEAAFLNTYQARWQMVADYLGHGYVQGKTMMFSRADLKAWGGLKELAIEAAEDAAATKIARRHRKEVRLVGKPFFQPLGDRTFREVWRRQMRWAQLRRRAFPLAYSAEIVTGAALPTALYIALWASDAASLAGLPALLVAWYAPEIILARAYRWPISPGLVCGYLLRDFLIPVIWLSGWFMRGFIWRGNKVNTVEMSRSQSRTAP
ncbi:glycosyltransferase [Agrobacterium vitis]|uniref:glycosyltransferase n=1 Tax=Agrobacterium vitis TaxID=373 RepID=UPI003D26EF1C